MTTGEAFRTTATAEEGIPAPLRDSESILAPIVIGFRAPEANASLIPSMSTAAQSIPPVTVMRKRMVGRKAVPTPHSRHVFHAYNREWEGYKYLARCLDVGPGETPADAFSRWSWEVSFFSFKEGYYQPAIPVGHEVVRLDVTRFRLTQQGIVAAAQLALFRHLFVECFRALDPHAVVFGGQRDWRAEWWPDPVSTSS